MSIKSDRKPGFDTRGLPDDYDPHQFYEYRYDTLVKTAEGIESFAYKYIPKSIMMSVAFAIDPLAKFKVAPHRITPENRTRKRAVMSVLDKRRIRNRQYSYSKSQTPNYNGISVCWSPTQAETITANFDNTADVTTQPPLVDEFIDTTSRTRLLGSEQGTMRFFKSYINSPPRDVRRKYRFQYIYHPASGIPSSSCVAAGGTGNNSSYSEDNWHSEIVPTAAVFFPGSLNTLKTQEYAYIENLLAKEGLAMLKEWSPNKRSSTLFRNLVELRDVSRSIISLQETLIAFRKLYVSLATSPRLRDIIFDIRRAANTVPSEYLSYHFGWKQLYKDLLDLLATPEKMSKKYNFLIARAGKPTTFRVKKEIISGSTGTVPDFDYTYSPYEYGNSYKSNLKRVTQLRLVVNATFDFPPINPASFRSHSFLDRIGLVPRPTDLYNLIPWTWLVDWFTGLGNYVELIDNQSRDDTLVNWGMITGHTTGVLTTELKSKVDNIDKVIEDFAGTTTWTNTAELHHASTLNYECSVRKDVASIFSVKTTCEPNLSAYQKSILGAILAQRKDALTRGAFRPKS
jgi:hypothetical protein